MAHGFAHAQLTLRAAGSGTLVVMAGHYRFLKIVTPALVAGIHVFLVESGKAWMPGTSPAMTPYFQFKNPCARKTLTCKGLDSQKAWSYRLRWIVSTR